MRIDDSDGGEEEGDDEDFIAIFEMRIEEEVNSAEELEKTLEQDMLLHDTSLNSRPFEDVSQQLALDNIHNLDDIGSVDEEIYGDNRLPKRVHGKCREPYQFGNLFVSFWYVQFIGPHKNRVEGRRTITRRQLGRDRQGLFCSISNYR